MSELPRDHENLAALFRAVYPKVTAVLVRILGDIDRAEEMTQEAIVKALKVWPTQGVPDEPAAWLITAGRNRAVDVFRHEKYRKDYRASLRVVHAEDSASIYSTKGEFEDDLLRLIFTCCHPVLSEDAQVTLTLKTVLGFSIDDIARAFLSSASTIDKRLTRAKQKIKQNEIPYEIPQAKELSARIEGVLSTIYLLFNKGFWAATDPALYRSHVCDDAIRLARMVTRLFRHHPEPRALLALMLLSSARSAARVDERGGFVPLPRQDRSRWDRTRIEEGLVLIDGIFLARHRPGTYQLQAAISAIHSRAASAEATDWDQIVALYEKLEALDPSPVISLNKASAMAQGNQTRQALTLLKGLETQGQLADYQPLFVTLAHVHMQAGDLDAAKTAQQRAIELSANDTERRYLTDQLGVMGN